MSTRANIGFYKATDDDVNQPHVMLYRHSDGYPDTMHGVVATLLPHLATFAAKRGADAEYMAAYALGRLQADNSDAEGFPSVLGYGITDVRMKGGIEWYYACYPDRMEVYRPELGAPKETHFYAAAKTTHTINR